MKLKTVRGSRWDGFDPEIALLGGVLQQACRDAAQTSDVALSREAWQFLDICAPDVAARLRKQQEEQMAAWHDLIYRIEALEARGLTVATDYRGQGLPQWLQPALGDFDVFVLNAKNVPTNSTLCVMRLSRLENLIGSGNHAATTADKRG